MNKEIKAQWIKALRSGEYKQGKRALRTLDNEFCCLGVLCDLYAKDTGVEWVDGAMHGMSGMTPVQVDQWAGLNKGPLATEEDYRVYDILSDLVQINDDGMSFDEIADVIEDRL